MGAGGPVTAALVPTGVVGAGAGGRVLATVAAAEATALETGAVGGGVGVDAAGAAGAAGASVLAALTTGAT